MREALQRLQAAGYVTARRGRGGATFVRTGQGPGSDEMIRSTLVPAWAQLSELLGFRQLVEQFHWPGGSKDVLLAFSLAVLAFGGFEAAAPLAEETR